VKKGSKIRASLAGARHMTIAASAQGGLIEVEVADDGPGIPPADEARIFEPFFTSRRASGGTGLGLPIVRSLLESYRGDILLTPSPQGATFRMTLPAAG